MNRPITVPDNAEIAKETSSSRKSVLSAIQRMMLGQPRLVPVGAMTISDLAREAGVGRHTLYRSPDLKDRFEYLRDKAEEPTSAELRLKAQMEDLKVEVKRLRHLQSSTKDDASKWKSLCLILGRAINVLQEELRQEQDKSGRLLARLEKAKAKKGQDSVVPIRSRRTE